MARGNVGVTSLPETYKLSDMVSGGDPEYYGYLAPSGGWYIMRIAGGNEFRYAKGAEDYGTNWTGKAGLTYGLYSDAF